MYINSFFWLVFSIFLLATFYYLCRPEKIPHYALIKNKRVSCTCDGWLLVELQEHRQCYIAGILLKCMLSQTYQFIQTRSCITETEMLTNEVQYLNLCLCATQIRVIYIEVLWLYFKQNSYYWSEMKLFMLRATILQ